MRLLRWPLIGMVGWLSLHTLIVPIPVGATANFNYATSVTYQVQPDGTTLVSSDFIVTNHTDRLYLSGLKVSTPTATIAQIKAAYSDGGAIPATTAAQTASHGDLSFPYQEISLTFPRANYGNGQSWEFKLSYSATGLVDTKGGGHTVYVPAQATTDPADTYTATVAVPLSFGPAHLGSAPPPTQSVRDGHQFFTFTTTELATHSLALAFGDETVYHANFNFPLVNDANFAKTLTVTLPPDLNNQHLIINQLQPRPLNTHLDGDGNILADYRLSAHQHLTVTTDISGDVHYRDYDLTKSGRFSDMPRDLVAHYTQATPYWQTNGAVAAAAQPLADHQAPVIKTVQALYQYVIDHLTYNENKIKFNVRQGAAQALAHPNNVVCLEYTDLLIALLRSQGIPARMPVGYAYSGSLKTSPAVADSLHAWVEAYVPGIGWMTLDPTWGEKFDQFGHSDLDHWAFAVWGRSDDAPAAVMHGAQDRDYQYEATTISFATTATAPLPSGAVQIQRYLLLPFIAWDRVAVTAQAGVASSANRVHFGAQSIDFGELGPSQRIDQGHWTVGGDWARTAMAQFSRADGVGSVLLASTLIQITWWPLLGLMLGVLAMVITFVVWRHHHRHQKLNLD